MKTNSQHFIKIEIKGDENNLPKEAGEFITYTKTGLINPYLRFNPSSNFDIERWLDEIEWYLIPEPQQPEQTESAEKYKLTAMDFVIKPGQCKYCGRSDNFASQSHNNTVVGPTEEEVMSYFNNHTSNVVNNGYVTLKAMVRSEFLDAIKWFRSQVREVELKEKVLEIWEAFILKTRRGDNESFSFRTFVDDYLSARKEGE